jgi:hypothetical protein
MIPAPGQDHIAGEFMRLLRAGIVLSSALILSLTLPVSAQTSAITGWQRVEGLLPHTEVYVRSDKQKVRCSVDSVTDDTLTCSQAVFSRAEIKSIKLPHRSTSTIGGLVIGAGIGAGVGAGIGSAINSGNKGTYVHTSGGKSAGLGAAVGVAVGIPIGSLIGHSKDLFASTVYKR